MIKTYSKPLADVNHAWHLIDVDGKVLGRIATQIAHLLMGKNKANYTPTMDDGDYVVVINAKTVAVTRNKAQDKIYYHHSNYPGGLKERTFAEMQARTPEKIIELAVYNMLPKNKLRDRRMTRLKVYAGAAHPHESQFAAKAGSAKA